MNRRNNLNKKAVSEIVAYSLLIIIAVSLSLVVYAWVTSLVPGESQECPQDVSLIISDYNCTGKEIDIGFENKGLFSIEGFFIRGGNSSEGLAIYPLEMTSQNFESSKGIVNFPVGDPFYPGNKTSMSFSFDGINNLKKLEVQPFKVYSGKISVCKSSIVKLNVDC